MSLRTFLGLAAALVLATGAAFLAASSRTSASSPASASAPVPPAPPPGVDPARWVPLSPTSGIALGPAPELQAPGVIRTGELWARVNGQWQIVRLPAAPPAGPATVPAAAF